MLECELLLKAFDETLYKNVGGFLLEFLCVLLFVFDFFFLLEIQGGTLRGILSIKEMTNIIMLLAPPQFNLQN